MGELVTEPYVTTGALVPIMTDYQLPAVGIYVVRCQSAKRKIPITPPMRNALRNGSTWIISDQA